MGHISNANVLQLNQILVFKEVFDNSFNIFCFGFKDELLYGFFIQSASEFVNDPVQNRKSVQHISCRDRLWPGMQLLRPYRYL